jgi:hypothetical protein
MEVSKIADDEPFERERRTHALSMHVVRSDQIRIGMTTAT